VVRQLQSLSRLQQDNSESTSPAIADQRAASLLLQWSPTSTSSVDRTAIASVDQLCSSPHRLVNAEKLGRPPSRCPPKAASDRRKDFSSTTHQTGKISVAPHSPGSPVAPARIARPARSQPLPDNQPSAARVRRYFSDAAFSGPSIQSCYSGCLKVYRHPTSSTVLKKAWIGCLCYYHEYLEYCSQPYDYNGRRDEFFDYIKNYWLVERAERGSAPQSWFAFNLIFLKSESFLTKSFRCISTVFRLH
jgi:hypothetical protein